MCELGKQAARMFWFFFFFSLNDVLIEYNTIKQANEAPSLPHCISLNGVVSTQVASCALCPSTMSTREGSVELFFCRTQNYLQLYFELSIWLDTAKPALVKWVNPCRYDGVDVVERWAVDSSLEDCRFDPLFGRCWVEVYLGKALNPTLPLGECWHQCLTAESVD